MQVQVKDIIRSYDFKPMAGRDDCYVEGEVIERNAVKECGFNAYKIRVTKDHWTDNSVSVVEGPDNRVGHEIFVPWNIAYNDYQGRVMNLTR